MEKIARRYTIIIAVLLSTSVLENFLTYEPYHEAEAGIETIAKIPVLMGDWQGKDEFLEERIYQILETRSIIHRSYRANGDNAFLSLVYHPETKVDFHSPEYCFGAQGVELVKEAKRVQIDVEGKRVDLDLNQLIYQRTGNKELVYYFYKSGSYMGSSYIQLRLALSANKLTNRGKSGSLVRVSTPIIGDDREKASTVLKNFIAALYPYLMTI